MSDTTARPSFLDRQRDAALAEVVEQQKEFRRVAELVIPSDRRGNRDKRVTDVIKLGEDHLVEVTRKDDTVQWTFVVDGNPNHWRHERQEDAILHLIASRYDANENTSFQAAFYAGRVLGQPAEN